MKILAIALVLLLGACSTTVPVTAKFPQAPGSLVQEPCPELQNLDKESKLSDVAKIVAHNYSEYYVCAVKLAAWQRWYHEQKIIYEGLK